MSMKQTIGKCKFQEANKSSIKTDQGYKVNQWLSKPPTTWSKPTVITDQEGHRTYKVPDLTTDQEGLSLPSPNLSTE